MGLLDFLFPKFCVSCKTIGSLLCDNCFAKLSFSDRYLCLVCNRASIDGLTHPACRGRYTIDGAFSGIEYKGLVKKLIYQYKYKPYLSSLTIVLGDLFYEGIIQHEMLMRGIDDLSITAVPLHATRFRQRGYNQSELLARHLSKKLNMKYYSLLLRLKSTRPQFGLSRSSRLENMKDAFTLLPQNNISKSIVIVDDVLTTGSTLLEAAKVLKKAGVKKVFGVTLARD